MRVFMLGWEFPPFISGGLGTACYGLTKAMSAIGTDVLFVLPRPVSTPFSTHVQLLSPHTNSPLASPETELRMDEFDRVVFRTVDSPMPTPYQRPGQPAPARSYKTTTVAEHEHGRRVTQVPAAHAFRPATSGVQPAGQAVPAPVGANYTGDMFAEIQRYAALATEIARTESFDVVHAHDWMTYPAGLAVAAMKGVPLVVHVHSTEFDRSGEHVDQRIYDIERRGMHGAIKVIAVSHLTKSMVTYHYGVDPSKVEVVYNAIETNGTAPHFDAQKYGISHNEKIVLFLGRITMQKGPEYFLAAAKRVLQVMNNVKFVMAGSGDMIRRTIEMAAAMGIGHKVLFTGFLRGKDVDRIFKMADLYVMPSVSEPFGIAPLEAMSHDVPVIISKQSGVSEVLTNALKVDFWDTDEMANKIVAVLRHPPLASTLREHGSFDVRKLSWVDSARQCVEIYESARKAMHGHA